MLSEVVREISCLPSRRPLVIVLGALRSSQRGSISPSLPIASPTELLKPANAGRRVVPPKFDDSKNYRLDPPNPEPTNSFMLRHRLLPYGSQLGASSLEVDCVGLVNLLDNDRRNGVRTENVSIQIKNSEVVKVMADCTIVRKSRRIPWSQNPILSRQHMYLAGESLGPVIEVFLIAKFSILTSCVAPLETSTFPISANFLSAISIEWHELNAILPTLARSVVLSSVGVICD